MEVPTLQKSASLLVRSFVVGAIRPHKGFALRTMRWLLLGVKHSKRDKVQERGMRLQMYQNIRGQRLIKPQIVL